MNDNVRLRREICRILVAMSAGEASDEQCARLDALVRDDSFARQCVVDAVTQMSDLEWEVRESMPAFNAVAGPSANQPAAVAPAPHHANRARRAGKVPSHWSLWRHSWGSVAAFSLGVAATLLLVFRLGFQRIDDVFVAEKLEPSRPATQAVARLVSNTSYLIDSQGGHAINTGDAIHAGRSVALFEGVAEVEFSNAVSIRLKGPALLAIDDAGIAHMKYGRLIVTNQGNRPFTLELPLATTTIAPDSYVGVDGHGDDVFVYAFEGQAELTPLRSTEKHVIAAKYGLRARRGARSEIVFTSLQANSTAFDFDLLMASDQITVAPEYAAMIVANDPAAYYRFEEADAEVVKNEMGPRHALEVKGDGVRITPRDGGGVAEFVLRDDAACLTSPQPFDELDGDYTIEMWVKPSHYQWGTLAALLERDHDEEGEIDRHALIVELQGANAPPEGSAKSLRFLHRSPPSEERGGTSCFSSAFYRAQSWQHVAAVKRGDQLNVYLNGELVASAVDATRLPRGLQLVIGQLFSFGTVRPFVGHIDELAIYARALSAEEIRRHVAMMRSAPAAPLKSQE
ncbi:LamG domain-containing protein [Lacipirellula parvula]|uniref:LamG-like jellyroll fold domain-containing protein n=1 Tax=Lacipirellula parvula TaxID=2650471 RepID=A0A5K7XDW7_9BACT|nr:LamG domain-containing protein [Lacipirellula parvula]BBO31219.1 hypothetical protein PLANPX_0831 [Lacipirellula parvula]